MGLFNKKPQPGRDEKRRQKIEKRRARWDAKVAALPFIEVPRGPRGGLGGRYFVLRGSADYQGEFAIAAHTLGLELPDDRDARISERAILEHEYLESGRRKVAVVLAGRTIGYADADERRRLSKILDGTEDEAVGVEVWLYRAPSGGWNARVIV